MKILLSSLVEDQGRQFAGGGDLFAQEYNFDRGTPRRREILVSTSIRECRQRGISARLAVKWRPEDLVDIAITDAD